MTRLAPRRPAARPRVDAARQPGRRIWRDAHLRRPAGGASAAIRPRRKLIARMAAQEQRHLDRFNALMAERRVRPTALQPLWNVAGFALGAATALMSEKAAMACTDAVETEIDRHYGRAARRAGRRRSRACRRHRRVPRRGAGASRHRARRRRDRGRRLSAADRGDPCRMPGGNRAVEAHMRNRDGGSPALAAERMCVMTMAEPDPPLAAAASLLPAGLAAAGAALAQAGSGSARSSSTAPTPARARPTTRSWSAPASPKPSATASRSGSARAARARRARPGPTRRATHSRPSARPASTAARRSGPAGFTGCLTQEIQAARQARQQAAEQEHRARAISQGFRLTCRALIEHRRCQPAIVLEHASRA